MGIPQIIAFLGGGGSKLLLLGEDGEPLLHSRRKKNLEMALIKQIESKEEYKR